MKSWSSILSRRMSRSAASTRAHVRREAALALGAGSALIALVAGRLLFAPSWAAAGVLALGIGALGAIAALQPGPRDEDTALTWTAVTGSFTIVPVSTALAAPKWVCVAAFLAAPVGLVLCFVWWSLWAGLRDLAEARSVEDGELASMRAGRWTASLAALTAPVALARLDPGLLAACAAVGLVGLGRYLAGASTRRRIRGWLAAVQARHVDGWRLVEASAFPEARLADLPTLARGRHLGRALDGVLVEVQPDGPYRGGCGGSPRARVPLDLPRSVSIPRRVPWSLLGSAVTHTGAFLAPLLAILVGLLGADAMAQAPRHGAGGSTVVGWLLVISGPVAGLLLFALGRLHAPARRTVWLMGMLVYALVCPYTCLFATFAA